tara:strand:- start:7172 stop:7438 length:267 start_codon:yes stop_codon:yes gene_type:complete
MNNWIEKSEPVSMEKRFEFKNYQGTKKFLDELYLFSKQNQIFPDISFGKSFASISIKPKTKEIKEINTQERLFATIIDELYQKILENN